MYLTRSAASACPITGCIFLFPLVCRGCRVADRQALVITPEIGRIADWADTRRHLDRPAPAPYPRQRCPHRPLVKVVPQLPWRSVDDRTMMSWAPFLRSLRGAFSRTDTCCPAAARRQSGNDAPIRRLRPRYRPRGSCRSLTDHTRRPGPPCRDRLHLVEGGRPILVQVCEAIRIAAAGFVQVALSV